MPEGKIEIIRAYPLPSSRLTDLTWDGSHFLQINRDNEQLLAIDPLTGELVKSGLLPFPATGVACLQGSLWVTDAVNRLVVKLEPGSLDPIARWPLPEAIKQPSGLTAADNLLWQADVAAGRIYALSPTGGELLKVIELDTHVWGVAVFQDRLYFSEPTSGLLFVFNLLKEAVTFSFELPGQPVGLAWNNGVGEMAAAGLWYVDAEMAQICQVRLHGQGTAC